jgi:tripartite-type tricarboxylate transporter receptor subunit TctC
MLRKNGEEATKLDASLLGQCRIEAEPVFSITENIGNSKPEFLPGFEFPILGHPKPRKPETLRRYAMRGRDRSLRPSALIPAMIFVSVGLSTTIAFAQAAFFQGKTVTVVQGRGPGGTGDLRVKALFPFLQKYIPGNPTLVAQYVPGAGGRTAANQTYKRVKPDGLTIGNPGAGLLTQAMLDATGVEYDFNKFIYLGSLDSMVHWLFITRKEAGFTTIEKLRSAAELRIGAQSVGHTIYNTGRLFAWVLGLKEPRFVVGYAAPELDLALLQGEVDAKAALAASALRLEKRLLDFHAIIDVPKGNQHSHLAYLPELESLARSDLDRKLVALQRAFRVTGTPFILPAGTPKDRVEILQEAFRKTFRDPEFVREYKKLIDDEPSPLFPEQLEKFIKEMPRDTEVIEVYKQLLGADPLSPR